ncbi:MAG: hypothetical protein V1862_06045 [Methanobacteriota archaeon]
MPENLLLISPPFSCGERNFYPLIRLFRLSHESGVFLSVTPVAIIIEQEGEWSFIALEEGVSEDIIKDISPARDINNP